MEPEAILTARSINAFYGKAQVIHDLSIEVQPGQIVALVGRNGAGKSTLMKALCGLVSTRSGSIKYLGEEIRGLRTYKIARRGMAFVPENRQIFPNLTTSENLAVGAISCPKGQFSFDNVYDIFPALSLKRNTLGQNLSGGEQQMLAISRALVTNP